MPFYPKKTKRKTFKTGPMDLVVMLIVIICFIFAFFFDSFTALKNETGEIMHSEKYWRETGDSRIPRINAFIIIGGLIMTYEMFLLTLEGKKRGRYLPWDLYYGLFVYMVKSKIREGINLTKEYFDERKRNVK